MKNCNLARHDRRGSGIDITGRPNHCNDILTVELACATSNPNQTHFSLLILFLNASTTSSNNHPVKVQSLLPPPVAQIQSQPQHPRNENPDLNFQMGRRRRRQKHFLFLDHDSLLLLCLLFFAGFSLVEGEGNATDQSSVTPINHDLYHTSAALLEEIEGLVHRHPDKFSIETISSRNKGYHAQLNVVTYCWGMKDCDGKSKLRILLSFGQHGRELITSELALRILSILSEEEFLPNSDKGSLNNTLDGLVIKVVPMENLNGRKLVEAGEFCERRNGRGVDLNRNWSVDWGKKEKDYDPYEENPGTAPFSEPETQVMRKLSMSFEPHIWVNVHSGMEALFMPYDHKNTTPDGYPSQRMRSILEKMNRLHLGDRCLIGSGGGSVGYLAHGTATDYMYDVARIPIAFTFEIYGDVAASSKDCFRMFNPMDISTFNKVLNDWSAAFFAMFKLGALQVDGLHPGAVASGFDKLISIDDYLNGYLMERRNRYGKKMEVLELGMQEIRTYFRLFLLSSVLLMFMFCSRISKSTRPIVSAISL